MCVCERKRGELERKHFLKPFYAREEKEEMYVPHIVFKFYIHLGNFVCVFVRERGVS